MEAEIELAKLKINKLLAHTPPTGIRIKVRHHSTFRQRLRNFFYILQWKIYEWKHDRK